MPVSREASRVFVSTVGMSPPISASVSTRPSSFVAGFTPRMCSTVGVMSTLPEGMSLTKPFLKSGPQATAVLSMS